MANENHTPMNKTIPWLGGKYAGELFNGIPHGTGRIILSNGTRYKGEWINGKPHGKGTILYPGGAIYSGEISEGKKDGYGKQVEPDQSTREGLWKNNRFIDNLPQKEDETLSLKKTRPDEVISLRSLTFYYKNGKGIKDVSFSVNRGEIFGFLGPNGAGKTTTIRNLLGFTRPYAGECTVFGLDCWYNAADVQEKLGYLPGEMAFIDEMSGNQFLDLIGNLRRGKGNSRRKALVEKLELDPSGKIRKMSKGMKQKLGIVTAFMHDPAVYILDEPTSGLDPLMQNVFVEMILKEKKRGKTILMSSHNFEEIYRTCDRAGIIRDGHLVAVENVHNLKHSQRKAFLVTLKDIDDLKKMSRANLEIGRIDNNTVEVFVSGNYDQFIAALADCEVLGLDVAVQTLEQVFMKYYGREKLR